MRAMTESRWPGVVASRGLASGAVVLHKCIPRGHRREKNSEAERRQMDKAVARARAALEALAAGQDEVAGAILEFQIALLDDEELLRPVVADIDDGAAAADAWRRALDTQIEGFESAGDENFAARAGDLRDLRDRVLDELAIRGPVISLKPMVERPIYVAADLTPSRFLEIDWTRYVGAALSGGAATSHVSILARARGIPMLINLEGDLDRVPDRTAAILDAERGVLVLDPAPESWRRFEVDTGELARNATADSQYLDRPAVTAAGRRVAVYINVDDPSVVDNIEVGHCDGIGLTRTEFLFRGGSLPDEEAQYRAYARLVDWAAGRPVTIRTLDAGGDKPIAGLTVPGETNPFLGLRGLRLSLRRPEVFIVQLRALARAAALGPVKVMCPMVTVPPEIDAARDLLERAVSDLKEAGVPCAMPQLGMMVEVPAAALTAPSFAVDFYSIGSNDLVQYTTATARDDPALAPLHDPASPAVVKLIAQTVEAGRASGREVSLCGDMASEPEYLALLLGAGVTAFSVAPAALARVKAAIARRHG